MYSRILQGENNLIILNRQHRNKSLFTPCGRKQPWSLKHYPLFSGAFPMKQKKPCKHKWNTAQGAVQLLNNTIPACVNENREAVIYWYTIKCTSLFMSPDDTVYKPPRLLWQCMEFTFQALSPPITSTETYMRIPIAVFKFVKMTITSDHIPLITDVPRRFSSGSPFHIGTLLHCRRWSRFRSFVSIPTWIRISIPFFKVRPTARSFAGNSMVISPSARTPYHPVSPVKAIWSRLPCLLKYRIRYIFNLRSVFPSTTTESILYMYNKSRHMSYRWNILLQTISYLFPACITIISLLFSYFFYVVISCNNVYKLPYWYGWRFRHPALRKFSSSVQ